MRGNNSARNRRSCSILIGDQRVAENARDANDESLLFSTTRTAIEALSPESRSQLLTWLTLIAPEPNGPNYQRVLRSIQLAILELSETERSRLRRSLQRRDRSNGAP